MVRGFLVLMLALCVLGGLYLLIHGPAFFMPDRLDPALGRQFGAAASRALGAGLLAMAGMGAIFLRGNYYITPRRPPGPAMQKLYFALAALAVGLMALAVALSEPVVLAAPAAIPVSRPATPAP
ncbi:MAG: hypothetical protein LBF50_11020 [Azoarcus sp.]|jgi:hypothetical protein|nr:hypothetical protein [Azoarcus sp.]